LLGSFLLSISACLRLSRGPSVKAEKINNRVLTF
jgi:hypothetical protein